MDQLEDKSQKPVSQLGEPVDGIVQSPDPKATRGMVNQYGIASILYGGYVPLFNGEARLRAKGKLA